MKTSIIILLLLCQMMVVFGQKKRALTQDQFYESLGRKYDADVVEGTMEGLKSSNESMIHRGPDGKRFTRREADSLKLIGRLRLVDTRKNLLGRLTAYYEYTTAWKGTKLPHFNAEDEFGNIYNAENLRGKVVAINLWYMGCSWCLFEIPELNEVVETFDGRPVEFLALGRDKIERIHAFL